MPPSEAPQPGTLGILLLSGSFDRAHYAFMLAAGAGSMGRPVVIFATNGGCHALCTDWSRLEGADADAATRACGVAGFDELREAASELGTVLLACDSGLRLAGIAPGLLLPDVAVAGIPSFLSATGSGQLISL